MSTDDTSTQPRSDAFDALASEHQHTGTHRTRKLVLYGAFLLVCVMVMAGVGLDRQRTRNAYANAVMDAERQAAKCDKALGKKRFWWFSVVRGTERCVSHAGARVGWQRARGNYTFAAVGDWGRDGLCCQVDVADEIERMVRMVGVGYVLSTGDNFYEKGIGSWKDEQVDRSWRNVYGEREGMQGVEWKVILGNHDHRGEVMAQVTLGREDKVWGMPERYWFEDGEDVFVAYLDTTCMYYKREALDGYFGGKESVSAAYRDEQIGWLRKKIGESKAKWKIVMGHHPFFSSCEHGVGEEAERRQLSTILLPIFKEHKVAMYICGHEHSLEHHEKDGIQFFVSGAGSKISPIQKFGDETRFALDRQGFMMFEMSADGESFDVKAVDLRGHVVYKTTVKRPQ